MSEYHRKLKTGDGECSLFCSVIELLRVKCCVTISNCWDFWFDRKRCVIWGMDSLIFAILEGVLWRGLLKYCITTSILLLRHRTLSCVFISCLFSFRFSTLEDLGIFKMHFIKMMRGCKYLYDFLHRLISFSQHRPFWKEEASQNFGPKPHLVEPYKISTKSESLNLLTGFRAAQGINLRTINHLQIVYSSPQCFPCSFQYYNSPRANIL